MRSAVDFLPSSMTLLITCWTRRERKTGSGSICRMVAAERRGIGCLLLLHAVLRAGLLAVADAGGVERPADDLVAHARQVLDPAAADQHDRVLLQVVPLAGDVGRDLDAARDADAGDLAQRRVRLLGRRRVHARAHPAPLRRGDLLLAALAGLQARRGQLLGLRMATLADQLRGRRHAGGMLAAAGRQTSEPVVECGAPTGLDSGEPRWRRKTANTAKEPTARNSDCQFCSVRSQKSDEPRYCHSDRAASRWSSWAAL